MIKILAYRDPGQQPDSGHAAVNDCWWDRRCRHRLAKAEGILRPDMAMHEEARRFHIQLFADVLADIN